MSSNQPTGNRSATFSHSTLSAVPSQDRQINTLPQPFDPFDLRASASADSGEVRSDSLFHPNFNYNSSAPAPPEPSKEETLPATSSTSHQTMQSDPHTTTTQGKPRARIYVACIECRGRKIRCDGTKPVCNNCARRSSECQYDAVPKRRGPDKKPGQRQRTVKKKNPDGEGDVDPAGRGVSKAKTREASGEEPIDSAKVKRKRTEDEYIDAAIGEDLKRRQSRPPQPSPAGNPSPFGPSLHHPTSTPTPVPPLIPTGIIEDPARPSYIAPPLPPLKHIDSTIQHNPNQAFSRPGPSASETAQPFGSRSTYSTPSVYGNAPPQPASTVLPSMHVAQQSPATTSSLRNQSYPSSFSYFAGNSAHPEASSSATYPVYDSYEHTGAYIVYVPSR